LRQANGQETGWLARYQQKHYLCQNVKHTAMRTLQITDDSPVNRPFIGENRAKTRSQDEEMFRPMTMAELNERIDRSLEDIRAGRTVPHEKVFKRYEQWL
jgi:hypothetical protein